MANNHWSAHWRAFLESGTGGVVDGSQERAAGVLCWGVYAGVSILQ